MQSWSIKTLILRSLGHYSSSPYSLLHVQCFCRRFSLQFQNMTNIVLEAVQELKLVKVVLTSMYWRSRWPSNEAFGWSETEIWCTYKIYQKYTSKICLINLGFSKFLSWTLLSSSSGFFFSLCVYIHSWTLFFFTESMIFM